MKQLALAMISAYQRYVSPHKGFCCAYRVHTGRKSCSVLGFRAIRRYGLIRGVAVLRRRTYLCGVAHRRYASPRKHVFHAQRGFCDIGCDFPCDLPSTDGCPLIGDCLKYCDCGGCDWSSNDKKKRSEERYVHIPPHGRNADRSCDACGEDSST